MVHCAVNLRKLAKIARFEANLVPAGEVVHEEESEGVVHIKGNVLAEPMTQLRANC